jgi:hypothetical protein
MFNSYDLCAYNLQDSRQLAALTVQEISTQGISSAFARCEIIMKSFREYGTILSAGIDNPCVQWDVRVQHFRRTPSVLKGRRQSYIPCVFQVVYNGYYCV